MRRGKTRTLGRDEIEDPLHEALVSAGVGEVTGGGTGSGCAIIDIEVEDLAAGLALIRKVLVELNVPRNTVINQRKPVKIVHSVYDEAA